MAGAPRFYKNNIAEGKGILVFAICIAVILRVVYFLNFGFAPLPDSDGYLWQPLMPFFSTPIISLLAGSAMLAGLALLAMHINSAYVFIRKRTVLPAAMILLVFSCHPTFIYMSPAYVGVLTMFLLIFVFFGSYNGQNSPNVAFRASFILGMGSLFVPLLLIYLPVVWIGLVLMRNFSFRAVLTSLFGLFIIYFPAFSYFFFTDNLQTFITPFQYNINELLGFPFLGFSIAEWSILGVWVLLFIVIVGDNYLNRHKDKIRVRAYLSLLGFIATIAFLFYIFFFVNPEVDLYIMSGIGCLLLAHFFALAEQKAKVVVFYIYLALYAGICALPFFSFL